MENEKTTKKWIKVTQKVTFNQEVELTDEQIEILENADELDISSIAYDGGEAFHLIEGLIDFSDVFDAEQEFTDFELTVNYYRLLTGACDFGVRDFMSKNGLEFDVIDNLTVEKNPITAKDLLPLLEKTNAYGLEKFRKLLTF